ncbi:1,4-alpha-glucan branching protein GlgB [Georgenia faecalis]|uniref:1,4-alpha-glucan branching enzyme GlgB n=1 Tax=Georgenia faecalis TaxID=2483799 RepID=A0ABV9DB72_9MICO|nr:1,4-alpha-glucan branching protein GlgB [Georgenia faecalis]
MALSPDLARALPGWVATQRWYAGKGHVPVLDVVGVLDLADPSAVPAGDGDARVRTWFLRDTAGAAPSGGTLYQVPLVERESPVTGLEHALVARIEDAGAGPRWVYDGCHDPAGARALLGALLDERDLAGDGTTGRGHRARGAGAVAGTLVVRGTRVLGGEQSNTSIVVDATADGTDRPLICKVFRVLAEGENPDVVVQQALAAAGSARVPAPAGDVLGSWPTPDGSARGHLAFASEFLPGVEDAWRVALRAASAGEDFTDRARALGEAVAEVHGILARTLEGRDADAPTRDAVVASWRTRAATAMREVPELAARESEITAVLEAGAAASWPRLQRIHGDLHLGQVLDAPGRGWVLLDFEGEPIRPLAERTAPDLALRDVAGMLRSFDYVAGSAPDASAVDAASWAADVRESFLGGYAARAGHDPRAEAALLAALELDKALYEAVYEVRNRPDWLPIPLAGALRLLGDPAQDDPARTHKGDDTVTAMNDSATPGSDALDGPTPQPVHVDEQALRAVAHGGHHEPHAVLGAHPGPGGVTVRTLRPLADAVEVVTTAGAVPLTHELEGIWVGVLPGDDVPDYRIRATYGEHTVVVDDPYRFLPTLGDVDQHLISEGRHEQLWTVLGAHVRHYPSELGDVHGTSFAVWAPNARAVRVKGDFNGWDGRLASMRSLGSTGVWEVFVPGAGEGARYKYEIQYRDGSWHEKADPMARAAEVPPLTASVVASSSYEWQDEDWMTRRARRDPHSGPMSVYEVHLGSWRQGLSYRDLADDLVAYVSGLGFTHVEFMPVAEHPFGGSWGYQVTSYYAPTSRYGSPDDLRYLIDRLHQAGIGVIVDWVPAHFPKDEWALANFDGTPLYEHPDPMLGEHPDWGTLIFNFGRREVRNFLVANASYWFEEFHVDGLRVDAVASMLYLDYSREPGQWRPNERGGRENLQAISFLQEANATAYRRSPGVVMIAEESTAWPGVTAPTSAGGLGFGLKWNMGWMNDTLHYLSEEPINRRYHHGELTFSLVYAFSEQFVLPLSHDEVVHGKGSLVRKMPGDRWQQLAGVRALLAYQWSHPGKQLLFMGSEFAQEQEWAESRSLDWHLLDNPAHAGVADLVRRLNDVYRSQPALWSDDFTAAGFEWIEAGDGDHNVLVYLRKAPATGEMVVCVVNFAGAPHEGYRVGLPHGGDWIEVLNTDAEEYGGSGVGNLGRVTAEDLSWHGRPASASLRVPPLGAVWLTPAKD